MSGKREARNVVTDMLDARLGGYAWEAIYSLEDYDLRLRPQFLGIVQAMFEDSFARAQLDLAGRIADVFLEAERERGPVSEATRCRLVRDARDIVALWPLPDAIDLYRRMKGQQRQKKRNASGDGKIGPRDVTYGKLEAAALGRQLPDGRRKAGQETNVSGALPEAISPSSVSTDQDASRTCVVYSEPGLDRLNSSGTSGAQRGQIEFRLKLAGPKSLGGPESVDAVDELFAEAYGAAPWCREFLAWAYTSMRDAYTEGRQYFWLPPVLLVGPPGTGKTFLAQMLARLAGVSFARLDLSARASQFDITGVEYGWGTASPGTPAKLIAEEGCANPMILLDEIEKSGEGSNAGSAADALLPLLQKETAARFLCPYVRANLDLSRVSFIATANDLAPLSKPLRDRFIVFRLEVPAGDDLLKLVTDRIGRFSDGVHVPVVVDAIASGRLSLRGLARLEAALKEIGRRRPGH